MRDDLDAPIEELNLSVRAFNCLKRGGLLTVRQVLALTGDELLGLRNFGRKSYDEVVEKLIDMGFIDPGDARWPVQRAPLDDAHVAADGPPSGSVDKGTLGEAHPQAPDGFLPFTTTDEPMTWRDGVSALMSAAIEEAVDHGYRRLLPPHLLVAALRMLPVRHRETQQGDGSRADELISIVGELPSATERVRTALHTTHPPASTATYEHREFVAPETRRLLTELEAATALAARPVERIGVALAALRLLVPLPSCRSLLASCDIDPDRVAASLADATGGSD